MLSCGRNTWRVRATLDGYVRAMNRFCNDGMPQGPYCQQQQVRGLASGKPSSPSPQCPPHERSKTLALSPSRSSSPHFPEPTPSPTSCSGLSKASDVYGHDPIQVGLWGMPIAFSILAGAIIVLGLLLCLRGDSRHNCRVWCARCGQNRQHARSVGPIYPFLALALDGLSCHRLSSQRSSARGYNHHSLSTRAVDRSHCWLHWPHGVLQHLHIIPHTQRDQMN